MPKIVERDWIMELEEAGKITSLEMQKYVSRMGAQQIFNVPELAAVLDTKANTVNALVDSGEIEYIDLGTGSKHYYKFSREAVFVFLKRRCNRV